MRNTKGTQGPLMVLTKQQRIAEAARQHPQASLTSLNHYMDMNWMREAYRRVRKDSAPGYDRQTVGEYGENLQENLSSLLERAKSGIYVAPPVRRVYIPKGAGTKETRPIGVLFVTGMKFMNWNHGKGGGGAIDLAMHLNSMDFKAAVAWLWHHFPGPPPPQRPQTSWKPTLRLPPRDDRKLSRVQRYLIVERGLASFLIEPLIESGTLYADNNAF